MEIELKLTTHLMMWYWFEHATIPVIVHDSVEAVGYSEDGTVGKLCADGLLNEIISLQIHGCRGFIQNQNLGLAQQSSCQTHQLTLTNTEQGQEMMTR